MGKSGKSSLLLVLAEFNASGRLGFLFLALGHCASPTLKVTVDIEGKTKRSLLLKHLL